MVRVGGNYYVVYVSDPRSDPTIVLNQILIHLKRKLYLGADLVAALASLKVNDFTHFL